jgi:sulfite reductase (NADPH) flavoprotein alpha-component
MAATISSGRNRALAHGRAFGASGIFVFRREPGPLPYVQHALAARAGRLRAWVKAGAAIYVCGDARGMAEGVDEVLERVLGQEQYELLRERGRYRRDVY